MRFFLGTHEPTWLRSPLVPPLFVSAVRLRLRCRKTLPVAVVPWALDSGGFSVLNKHGSYPTTNREYAAEVRRWASEIGRMEWAATQDWMCEPVVIARTGLSVAEHQQRTVDSYRELIEVAPDFRWTPVIQGFKRDDYLRCLDLYERAGIDLRKCLTVGVGSVCRRQSTAEAEQIIRELASCGLRLHGFGFKIEGLEKAGDALVSADSLAWSFGGRRDYRKTQLKAAKQARMSDLFDCGERVIAPSAANSMGTALDWLDRLKDRTGAVTAW